MDAHDLMHLPAQLGTGTPVERTLEDDQLSMRTHELSTCSPTSFPQLVLATRQEPESEEGYTCEQEGVQATLTHVGFVAAQKGG
jgi:hypothetical protein